MTQTVTARAPATVANVGPGFDALGFAFTGPYVEVTVSPSSTPGITISSDHDLPTDPMQNTAGVAISALCEHEHITPSLNVHIHAGIPIGSGLGSSAASAVAAAVAANAALGCDLQAQQLLPFAMAGEAVASKAVHADNVAPALLGGFGIVRSHDPVDWIPVSVPEGMQCVAVYPSCEVKTADARKVLPQEVTLEQASRQWARVAALVAGFSQSNFEIIARALQDELIEPHRGKLIPGYEAVKRAAYKAGALACVISGSGPTMLSVVDSEKAAEDVEYAMKNAFSDVNLHSHSWIGAVQSTGAEVVSVS